MRTIQRRLSEVKEDGDTEVEIVVVVKDVFGEKLMEEEEEERLNALFLFCGLGNFLRVMEGI